MKKIKIKNETEFRNDLYRYTLDRRKLPFKNNIFDIKSYLELIEKYNPSLKDIKYFNPRRDYYTGKQIIKLIVLKKENSIFNEDLYFYFLVEKNCLKYLF